MTARAQGNPLFKGWDRNAKPLAGGLVHTFEAGTTTRKATFADAAGTAANTNPVILDSAGEAAIFWGTGRYKVRVEDAQGVLQWEVDGYDPQVIDLPAPAVNLVANGSFEADTDGDGVPDGWTLTPFSGGTADVERYDADTNPTPDLAHGEAALRFVSPGGSGNGGGYADQTDYFEVTDGEALDVAVWVKATVAGVHNKVDVRWFDAAKAAHATPQTTVWEDAATNPTSWTEQRARVAPPAGARFAKLRLYGCADDNATAGTTRFDHVTVRAVLPQYLRSGEADQVDGVLTFAAQARLNNAVSIAGKETGGTLRSLIHLNNSNQVAVGDAAAPLRLFGNGITVASGDPLWHAGNDGAGSGLDADLLDGVQGTGFVRADVADQVDGILTFANHQVLNNGLRLYGKDSGGASRNLVTVSPADTVDLGDSNNVMLLYGAGTAPRFNGNDVWHAGNDGAGSGLDADTLDGLQGSSYATAAHSHLLTAQSILASGVTVTSSFTNVGTALSVPVQLGQTVEVEAYISAFKGATAGTTQLQVQTSTSDYAMWAFYDSAGNLVQTTYQPANETYVISASGRLRVLGNGTISLQLRALSAGSNATTAGQIVARRVGY